MVCCVSQSYLLFSDKFGLRVRKKQAECELWELLEVTVTVTAVWQKTTHAIVVFFLLFSHLYHKCNIFRKLLVLKSYLRADVPSFHNSKTRRCALCIRRKGSVGNLLKTCKDTSDRECYTHTGVLNSVCRPRHNHSYCNHVW